MRFPLTSLFYRVVGVLFGFESRLALFLFPAGGLLCQFSGLLFSSHLKPKYNNGKAPSRGSAFPFSYLISNCRASPRLLPLLFDRIKVFHDSHVYGPGHSVLIFLIFQAFGFLSITQESAFHYDNRLLHMKQEIIVVIGLGHPLVGLAQHIVKALLQNFRQILSLL